MENQLKKSEENEIKTPILITLKLPER